MSDHTSAIDNTIRIGDEVVTSDGHTLGKVKELTSTHFKVDASMRPDYWLMRAEIAAVEGERVRMAWPEADADRKQVPGPEFGQDQAGREDGTDDDLEPRDELAEHDINEAARSSMYRSRFGV